jgi:hypothetical protein
MILGNKKEYIREFDEWLKTNKGLKNRPGVKKRRKQILQVIGRFLEKISKDNPTIFHLPQDIISKCKQEVVIKSGKNFVDERDALNLFISFLETNIDSEDNIPLEAIKFKDRQIIGRLSITKSTPAAPDLIPFWVEDKDDLHIEIGSIITCTPDELNDTYLVAIVDEIQSTSLTNDAIEDFYARGYGDPTTLMATRRPIIRHGKAEVVFRSDGRYEPPNDSWRVYFSNKKEIMEAYGANIPKQNRVLIGFTWDANKKPVPIYGDANYLLGLEGAHINIAGASGLATKTSYALFLLQSILSYANINNKSIATIAFNVKEADLMRIDEGPESWDKLYKLLNIINEDDKKFSASLWKYCKKEGVDPFQIQKKLKFFAPQHAILHGGQTLRQNDVELFSYGLLDFIYEGGLALLGLLEPEDIDEKVTLMLSAISDAIKNNMSPLEGVNTFKGLFQRLSGRVGQQQRGGQWIDIGITRVHEATLTKVIGRMQNAVTYQLPGLILEESPEGNPIRLWELKSRDFWIIDISRLHPKGQRIVFYTVIKLLSRLLESKRNQENEIKLRHDLEVSISDFPDKVVVFVDELNKFAPRSGKAPLKEHVIDIAARGRSIGLSLIGAQQLASQVDDEILANCATFALGRSHFVELGKGTYQWLPQGMRKKATVLKKGNMFMFHAIHTKPVEITFPLPLHYIM